jgi:hypothetical protein
MSIASRPDSRSRSAIVRVLDAPVNAGCQYGRPVEVTVRDILAEAPCFLVLAAIIGAIVFI